MLVPLPDLGDTSWYDWATEIHAEVDALWVMTTDGDLITRAGGVPARITRADLAVSLSDTLGPSSLITDTTTARTLALADGGHPIGFTNASPVTVTVPTNATVAFPIGVSIPLLQLGAGQVEVAAAVGVTVSTAQSLLSRAQYSGMTLLKIGTNSWVLMGDME